MIALLVLAAAGAAAPPPPPGERLLAAAVLISCDHSYRETARELASNVLDELRAPGAGGEYRWAHWAPGGGPTVEESERIKAIDGSTPQTIHVKAEHASRIRVEVPERRSLFSGNYACTVHRVTWSCATWRKEVTVFDRPRRFARGDDERFPLPDVCPALEVEVTATVDADHRGESELSVQVEAGHLEDDPDSPHYDAARRLARILATGSTTSDDTLARELRTAASDLGLTRRDSDRDRPTLRRDLRRIRALLDGSARDQRQALDSLDDLINALP